VRYGLIAENPLERLALASGQFPTPMLEAYGAAFSRALMVATKLGVFDTLAGGPLTAREVAAQRGADPRAVEKLLNLLVAMRYVRSSRTGEYRLSSIARRWLVGNGARNVRDTVLMKFLEWRWIEGLEDFVRSGEPLDVHATMTKEDWALYQRGMRAQASLIGPLLARRMPVAAGADDARHRRLARLLLGGDLPKARRPSRGRAGPAAGRGAGRAPAGGGRDGGAGHLSCR